MGLNWISSNEIRNYFPTSEDLIGAAGDFSICKTPGKTKQWMQKQSFICQQGEGDTWALVHTSKQLQQNGACDPSKKKGGCLARGELFIPFLGCSPSPNPSTCDDYMLARFQPSQVLQEFFHQELLLNTAQLKIQKSYHCPKKHWCESLLLIISEIILLISSL